MKLNLICIRIAGKMLGNPGTFVERTGRTFSKVVNGGVYKVLSSHREGSNLILEGSGEMVYAAENFKKAKHGVCEGRKE